MPCRRRTPESFPRVENFFRISFAARRRLKFGRYVLTEVKAHNFETPDRNPTEVKIGYRSIDRGTAYKCWQLLRKTRARIRPCRVVIFPNFITCTGFGLQSSPLQRWSENWHGEVDRKSILLYQISPLLTSAACHEFRMSPMRGENPRKLSPTVTSNLRHVLCR